jgi:hypothetical protein
MPRPSLPLCAFAALALTGCHKGDSAPSGASSAAPAAPTPSAAATTHAAPSAAPSAAPAAPAPAAAGGACGFDGVYEAVGYACKGEKKQTFPSFMRWKFTMNGLDGPFEESTLPPLPSCVNGEAWKAACAGTPTVLTLTASAPSTCTPAGCMRSNIKGSGGTACGKMPAPLIWSVVEHTATTLVLTSVEPFKLTTCTSSHKSNPLTVWWQKK